MSANSNLPLRIYPLSIEEFLDDCDAKCYFRYGLQEQCGRFYYRSKPIVADTGTIVLFQYNQHIVAQAELMKVHKLEVPMIDGDIEYHGYFLFDLETVYYYQEALNAEEFYEIYPDKILGRVAHILDNKERNSRLLKKLSGLQDWQLLNSRKSGNNKNYNINVKHPSL